MSSVTRHQFLSQELLCRVPPFFVKRAKEKLDCTLRIVSRYIIHGCITKYNYSENKTGIRLSGKFLSFYEEIIVAQGFLFYIIFF